MSDRSKTRLYYAACICLLITAAALRFYDLPGRSMGYDEAVAANNSRGSLREVLHHTRNHNSSPILYPLVLYAVQKVESSPSSVRIVPAIASVLTVAAILFLLPRVGVSRWAAFVAALLSALSLSAIEHARNGREYSIDTFVAVLMIAGLLAYLRGRRGGGTYVLFSVSLFVAPLVQYGLVLLVMAIFGTISVMEAKTLWGRRAALRGGLRSSAGWIWRRLSYLAWPVACFATGSLISYVATLRRHLELEKFTGPNHRPFYEFGYYQGEHSDIPAMIRFVLSQTEAVLHYHVTTEFLTILGLVGFVIFLITSFGKKRLDIIATLFLLSMLIAACASLIHVYLYAGTRHSMYLAPIIFLAFGHALHSIVVDASSITRRRWTVHAGMTLVAGVIASSGIAAIRDHDLYEDHLKIDSTIHVLEELVQEGDAVYFTVSRPIVRFYSQRDMSNYYYSWDTGCVDTVDLRGCIDHILKSVSIQTNRLWVVAYEHRTPKLEMLEELHEEFHDMDAVRIVVEGFEVSTKLYVLEDPHLFDRLRKPVGDLNRRGELVVSSKFEVYLREDDLSYIKESCVLEDVAEKFFLHVTPTNVDDLPDDRKQYGFENLDFAFLSHGIVTDGKCVAVRDLPEYDIESISTGQFAEDGVIWSGGFNLGESDALLSAYQYAANSAPAAQSVFDVYGGEGRLIYVKEPCVVEDVAARFLLHVTPVDVEDLPEERKEHGFDNLDFDFGSHGIVAEGRCIAARDLPEYDIDSILTGQFADDGEIWRSEIPFTDD